MSSVVLIAYSFPPDGGAAVYRPLRFVRRLPAMGWHPTVVTAHGRYDRYDPDLMESVPRGIEIVRVSDGDIWHGIQAKRATRLEKRIASGVPRVKLQTAHQRPGRSFA